MFDFLFLDLDDTILDFRKAEYVAIGKTIQEFGLEPTETLRALYSRINDEHWKRLERGELTRDQVRVGRFSAFFGQMGLEIDPAACAKCYVKNLGTGHYFLPGALEALQTLQGKYRLFLASNGTSTVQRPRIESAGIAPYFEQIFISHELGVNKPSREFFERCFARIPGFDPGRCLMVGDSLSSDIQGGSNAGLATCWVNPQKKSHPETVRVDYQIESFAQLPGLLEQL